MSKYKYLIIILMIIKSLFYSEARDFSSKYFFYVYLKNGYYLRLYLHLYSTLNNYNVIIDIFVLGESNEEYYKRMGNQGKLFSIHK